MQFTVCQEKPLCSCNAKYRFGLKSVQGFHDDLKSLNEHYGQRSTRLQPFHKGFYHRNNDVLL